MRCVMFRFLRKTFASFRAAGKERETNAISSRVDRRVCLLSHADFKEFRSLILQQLKLVQRRNKKQIS